jgi:hypothetical protein
VNQLGEFFFGAPTIFTENIDILFDSHIDIYFIRYILSIFTEKTDDCNKTLYLNKQVIVGHISVKKLPERQKFAQSGLTKSS